MRGNPCGSQPGIGSLVSAEGTCVMPNVGLLAMNALRPSAVNGNSCSGLPSDGIAFAPSAPMPSAPPFANSQTPEMSRGGAGPDLLRAKSTAQTAPGARPNPG